MITTAQKQAVILVVTAILETIHEAGPSGVPATPIYMALQAHGLGYDAFVQIMSALVAAGKVRHRNNTYFATEAAK